MSNSETLEFSQMNPPIMWPLALAVMVPALAAALTLALPGEITFMLSLALACAIGLSLAELRRHVGSGITALPSTPEG